MQREHTPRALTLAVAVAFLLLMVAACSGDSDADNSGVAGPTVEDTDTGGSSDDPDDPPGGEEAPEEDPEEDPEEGLDMTDGTLGDGPQGYGDDPQLDSMWDDCEAGDMRACDLLYFQVSTGSAYEEHAETCGGTDSDTTAFCSEDTDVNEDWLLDPDSAAALILVADCESGDFTACDLLYQIAPVDSDLENWGSTCAERVPVAALPDCRTLLG